MPQFFEAAVMTNAGAALLSRCIADEVAIVFTGVVVGDGSYTNTEKTVEALRQRTALKSLQITYEPQSVIREDNSSVRVSSVITNVDSEGEAIVTSGFYINEIGLMAKPEDDATVPILFSVSVTSGTRGDYMPAYTGDNPAKIIQGFVTAISVDASVTLEEPTAPYALSEDLQDLADSIDSRLVAKADLVGGKVPSAQLPDYPDVSGKADKVSGATNGNFAGLDANGNLTDSGKKASDFATSAQISGKADKVSGATSGHFAGLDSNGNLTDSGKSASDLLTVSGDGSIFSTHKYVNISDGTDLNNIKAPGTYGTAGYDGTTNIVNSPFGNNPFSLLVENQMKAGQGFIRQIAKKYNSNTVMMRYSNDTGSTWSAWASFAMSTDSKPAWQISSGTFLGQVNADATSAANVATFQMRDIRITVTDPGEGSALDSGKIVIVI